MLDTKSAAARIGYAAKTLRNKRVTGDGPPFVKLRSGAVRYEERALDEWARREGK